MTARINPNYCIACNKWDWDITLVKFGAYFYHQGCLDKLNAGICYSNDAEIHKRLSKAFGKVKAIK